MDCPICGFQRSLHLLLDGQIGGSIAMFPPILVMVAYGAILFLYLYNPVLVGKRMLKASSIATLCAVFLSYFMKLLFIL